MKHDLSLSADECKEWERIQTFKAVPASVVLAYAQARAKKSGLIVLIGVNFDGPRYVGRAPEWQYVFQASKPRKSYLNYLGDYFKVYPDGKIMRKAFNGWIKFRNL